MKWDDIKDKPREIDKLIAEYIFNEVNIYCVSIGATYHNTFMTLEQAEQRQNFLIKGGGERDVNIITPCLPKYSTDIAAAWEAVEKLDEYAQTMEKATNFYAWTIAYEGEIYRGEWSTAPMAICRAALLAKGVIE